MGYYEKEYRRRLNIGQEGNSLVTLIAINLIVFVIFSFIYLVYVFNTKKDLYELQVLNWFTMPADTGKLMEKPWTIITHFFLHTNVWHIIGNMLWLWLFGYILQDLTGARKLVPIFIYGALAGAGAFMLSYNIFDIFRPELPFKSLLGASAGVMAIAAAATMISPKYRIFPMLNGGFPLWILMVVFVIIDLATIPTNNPGGHIAHLGGAAMGVIFVMLMKRGYDASAWMNNVYDWFNELFAPSRAREEKRTREKLFYKGTTRPFTRTPNLTQQKVDEILDKINQKGYNHLSEEEKELLKRASQEDL